MKLPLFLTLTAAAWLCLATQAQVLTADQVPAVVKQGFQAKFPVARAVSWKIKSDKNYEAEFTAKGTEMAVKFDSAGKWLETESAISHSQLPKAVRSSVGKRFPGYKIVETQTVQRANVERLIYEVHVENALEIVKAQLSAEGAVLNQAAKPKPDKPAR